MPTADITRKPYYADIVFYTYKHIRQTNHNHNANAFQNSILSIIRKTYSITLITPPPEKVIMQ